MLEGLFVHYATVSKRLGLAFEEGRIHGVLDGVPLQMSFGTHSVHVTALLRHAAPVDVSIATKGLVEKLKELFGGHGDTIGEPALDAVFVFKTSNPSRLAQLLDPTTRLALLDAAALGLHPAVDSHSIHLRRFSSSAISDDEATIERDFRLAVKLARIISDSFFGQR